MHMNVCRVIGLSCAVEVSCCRMNEDSEDYAVIVVVWNKTSENIFSTHSIYYYKIDSIIHI